MNKLDKFTQSYLEERFSYDTVLGELRWKPKAGMDRMTKVWNGRYAGKIAGTLHHGHSQISIDDDRVFAHAVIWKLMFGNNALVDHANRLRSDNRLLNLREATPSQNTCNQSLSSRNKTGIIGVSWDKRTRRWRSVIGHTFLGHFDTIEDATAARLNAEKIWGEFAPQRHLAASGDPGKPKLRKSRRNRSGVIGVSYVAKDDRWRADIKHGSKSIYLGYFKTKEEAIAARRRAEVELDHPCE